MASFNGRTDIMGNVLSMRTIAHPVRHQLDSFPGVNGRSSQRLGGDGGRTEAVILLTAINATARLLLENVWRGYQQQGAALTATLTDLEGVSWTNTYVLHFEPMNDPHSQPNLSLRTYLVVFEHLA